MRSVGERCDAVRSRAWRLRRRRDGRAATVVAALSLFALVDLAGRAAVGGSSMPPPSAEDLFGASSLFGPSAGGYVLVAVVTAVVVTAVTTLCAKHRRSSGEREGDSDSGDEQGRKE